MLEGFRQVPALERRRLVERVRLGLDQCQVVQRIKALERENRELRQANEILRKASAYFAVAELDRPFRR
ncbi:hypothetical protein LCGC14_0308040 [marine sediment metagenome]|uniref:Transposase IS3/IS911 family protein n=1 Tax=marine sediment metagenome TaxID=412755 RepID=A0A0F9U5P4_9ZZZZ